MRVTVLGCIAANPGSISDRKSTCASSILLAGLLFQHSLHVAGVTFIVGLELLANTGIVILKKSASKEQ